MSSTLSTQQPTNPARADSQATLPAPASARVYELTDWGYDLRPVILALGRWGSHAPFRPGDTPLSPDAMMLVLPTDSTLPGRTA